MVSKSWKTKHTIGLSVLVLDEGCDETLCKRSGVGEKEPFKHVLLFYGVDRRLSKKSGFFFHVPTNGASCLLGTF